MDTRTPRTPTPSGGRPGVASGGGLRGFFDDEPVLSTVKVRADPAQVIVNHASFRVQLSDTALRPATGPSAARSAQRAAAQPVAAETAAPAAPEPGGRAQRRAPVVWTGRTDSGDTGATGRLLQAAAVTAVTEKIAEGPAAATQLLPRVPDPAPSELPDSSGPSVIGGQRGPRPPESVRPRPLLSGVQPVGSAFDEPADGEPPEPAEKPQRPSGRSDADRRQAYWPGHRMNLGVVLLPMRIFLGLITLYGGLGKLCNPVYFDGGERGSMVTWLRNLEPWTVAEPLRDFALAHPVGSGLTVAFLQIVVGVLTMLGLWQRLAASFGALLSVAILMTVSWGSGPVYEAPDIIFLAAWSPLIIAGAPVYSVDAHLASDAWRKLGPRVDLAALRGRVLRRGGVIATVVVGLALLLGSMLGGAVRSSQQAPLPREGEQPVNQLPGSPLPEKPGTGRSESPGRKTDTPGSGGVGTPAGPSSRPSGQPSQQQPTEEPSEPAGEATRQPAEEDTPADTAPPQPEPPADPAPGDGSPDAGGTSGGTTGGGEETSPGGGSGEEESSSGRGGGGALGGLLG